MTVTTDVVGRKVTNLVSYIAFFCRLLLHLALSTDIVCVMHFDLNIMAFNFAAALLYQLLAWL